MTQAETIEAAAEELDDMAMLIYLKNVNRKGDWPGDKDARNDYDRLCGLVAALREIAKGMR